MLVGKAVLEFTDFVFEGGKRAALASAACVAVTSLRGDDAGKYAYLASLLLLGFWSSAWIWHHIDLNMDRFPRRKITVAAVFSVLGWAFMGLSFAVFSTLATSVVGEFRTH